MQGGNWDRRRLAQTYGNFEAGRVVDGSRAERAHHRRLLLGRLELDETENARRAPVVDQPELVHRTVRLAQIEYGLGERMEVARSTERIKHFGFHAGDARERQ